MFFRGLLYHQIYEIGRTDSAEVIGSHASNGHKLYQHETQSEL